jgi:hypothetical protein
VRPGVVDRDATLRQLIALDNRVLDGLDDVITGLHVCRGNDRSHFTGTEPYDDLAASIFPYVSAQRLLLEYDDERSGGFGPLPLGPGLTPETRRLLRAPLRSREPSGRRPRPSPRGRAGRPTRR